MDQTIPTQEKPGKPSPVVFIVITLFILGVLYVTQKDAAKNDTMTVENSALPTPTGTQQTQNNNVEKTDMQVDPNIVKFTIKGSNFKYDIDQMKVKKGATVQVTFINSEGTHDWKLDEFNAKTSVLKAEAQETITFVADKAGTFEYYCSIGQHRQMGMVGKFIVE